MNLPLLPAIAIIFGVMLVSLGAAFSIGTWIGAPRKRAPLPPLERTGRRLTPARHALMLEHMQQLRRDLDSVSEKAKAPDAIGDAAMLYLMVLWLLPVTDELLHEHVKISPAMTKDEEAPRQSLNERYRDRAAGAFGMAKPDGERPV